MNTFANSNLNESINAIMNSRMDNTEKRNELLKLSLTNMDVNVLFHQKRMADLANAALRPSRPRLSLGFTFGVEIECDCRRNNIYDAAENTGFQFQYQHYNHVDGHDFFKFVSDASLSGASPIECVSPVLSGTEGRNRLKIACDTLVQAGARVNRSCGLHVHIGAASLTGEQYANVFVNYAMLESIIDGFMPRSRHDNRYAKALRGVVASLKNCHTVEAVKSAMHRDRYYKVNCVSYDRHRTIEFRQHAGSVNYTKIKNWVMFCGKLVEWSKTHRLDVPVESIDAVEFLSQAEKRFFKGRSAALNNAD